MGLWVGFDVVEDLGFIEATPEYGIEPDYSEGCAIFVDTFLQVAHSLVPVDTGYLDSTIDAESSDTWCEATATAEYAQYVEYGTWKMGAQPYFEPAYYQAVGEAMPAWIAAQEEALQEEEELLEMEEEEEAEQSLEGIGGVNTSSFSAFLGGLLATFIVALVITTVEAMLGRDFSSGSSGGSFRGGSGDGGGGGNLPDVEII